MEQTGLIANDHTAPPPRWTWKWRLFVVFIWPGGLVWALIGSVLEHGFGAPVWLFGIFVLPIVFIFGVIFAALPAMLPFVLTKKVTADDSNPRRIRFENYNWHPTVRLWIELCCYPVVLWVWMFYVGCVVYPLMAYHFARISIYGVAIVVLGYHLIRWGHRLYREYRAMHPGAANPYAQV